MSQVHTVLNYSNLIQFAMDCIQDWKVTVAVTVPASLAELPPVQLLNLRLRQIQNSFGVACRRKSLSFKIIFILNTCVCVQELFDV